VTPNTKAIIRNLRSKKIYIDCYTLIETLFNVLEHRLVPTHTVCTPSEKKKIFDKYAIGPDQLPHIKLIDPTIRHLGAMRGNLIKIVRESETQPGYFVISYRLVV
jgi:DNA-directed RNA polymerase subunit H (RpoH/RPB5)